MTVKKVAILLWLGMFYAGSVHPLPTIPGPVFDIPPNIKAITDVDSLRRLLAEPTFKDKIGAYLRLGEIGGQGELPLLMQAFDNELYSIGIEAMPGVKYFSLISIGQIGGPVAERFLRDLAAALAPNLKAGTTSFLRADSLMILGAALKGLGEVGTVSAGAFLDSVFENTENTLMTRSNAYLSSLEIKIKHNTDLKTAADTAQFLIEKWQQVPWARTPYTTAGVSADYLVRTNIEALLYQYRSVTLPYVVALEDELTPGDPKTAALIDLRQRMEANPAEPKE